jgi:hypothetical protein
MLKEELKTKITELLPAATFEEGGEWLNINIEPKDLLSICATTTSRRVHILRLSLLSHLYRLEDTSHHGVSFDFYQISPQHRSKSKTGQEQTLK